MSWPDVPYPMREPDPNRLRGRLYLVAIASDRGELANSLLTSNRLNIGELLDPVADELRALIRRRPRP